MRELAETYGTPAYVYSKNGILTSFRYIDKAFARLPHLTCFALKSNSNLEVIKLLNAEGAGADVVSGGELALALKAGFPPSKIVYAGVGKTEDEIAFAIDSKILALNIESRQELEVTADIAHHLKTPASIAIRVNPDLDIAGHPYLTTGRTVNKFGISASEALECYRWAASHPWLQIQGVHCHLGSMIDRLEPFIKATKLLIKIADELDIFLKYIDIGGGFGVNYENALGALENTLLLKPNLISEKLYPILSKFNRTLIIEPGRSIVAQNGILLTKILYIKKTQDKNFAIVDAGMNDLIRPALYGARHEILTITKNNTETQTFDVVGPICESGDFLGKDIQLPVNIKRGDNLAVMTAGGYGYALASNYNSRPRPVEIMVHGNHSVIIRKREKFQI